MTDAVLAKVLATLLLRLYSQCYTTVEVGDVWETRLRPESIYAMGRDNPLAAHVMATRWHAHPRGRVISAMCVR
jgi:hypothetical protein